MTPISWPGPLIEALAKGDCVIFVGAGFSKNAQAAPGNPTVGWVELLERLLDEIVPKSAAGRRTAKGSAIANQIKNGDLLWAAQALESEFAEAGRLSDFRLLIADTVDGPTGSSFQPGKPHDALLSLDARTIVTTNYDKILDRLFADGYTYLTYKNDNIAETVRLGKPVVLKLHGTIDDPHAMILTRLDFAKLRRVGNQALAVMEALALTRTVLFLGYSLDDPDLHLILENQFSSSGASPGHYLLGHASSMTDEKRKVFSTAFGVEVIRFKGDRAAGFLEALGSLASQVESVRASRGLTLSP